MKKISFMFSFTLLISISLPSHGMEHVRQTMIFCQHMLGTPQEPIMAHQPNLSTSRPTMRGFVSNYFTRYFESHADSCENNSGHSKKKQYSAKDLERANDACVNYAAAMEQIEVPSSTYSNDDDDFETALSILHRACLKHAYDYKTRNVCNNAHSKKRKELNEALLELNRVLTQQLIEKCDSLIGKCDSLIEKMESNKTNN